jgi:hypothetical protein
LEAKTIELLWDQICDCRPDSRGRPVAIDRNKVIHSTINSCHFSEAFGHEALELAAVDHPLGGDPKSALYLVKAIGVGFRIQGNGKNSTPPRLQDRLDRFEQDQEIEAHAPVA